MNKTHVETQSTIRGLVTAETTEHNRDIDIYIRETYNSKVTAEATIRLSPEGFYALSAPILEAMGCEVDEPAGGF